jgi:DNA-directed RNA polymerase specialized sigma24 family protein
MIGSLAMPNENSVSQWLDGIKAGDSASIERLWQRYFERLVRLARGKLPGNCRRAFDEEDVAISVFQSFCERASRGQFPQLSDRDDLWRLLFTLTMRKVVVAMRHQTRQKRGGGHVLGESALMRSDLTGDGLAQFFEKEPTPDEVLRFTEDLERFLNRLDDTALKTVAVRKLEGYGIGEIAAELGASTRTVERKLRLIRAIWEQELPV